MYYTNVYMCVYTTIQQYYAFQCFIEAAMKPRGNTVDLILSGLAWPGLAWPGLAWPGLAFSPLLSSPLLSSPLLSSPLLSSPLLSSPLLSSPLLSSHPISSHLISSHLILSYYNGINIPLHPISYSAPIRLDLSHKRRKRLHVSTVSLTCLNLHSYWLLIKLILINTYSFCGHILNCQCLQTSKNKYAGNIGHVNSTMSAVVDRQTAKNVYTMKFEFVATSDVDKSWGPDWGQNSYANNTPSINLTHTTEPLQVLCK